MRATNDTFRELREQINAEIKAAEDARTHDLMVDTIVEGSRLAERVKELEGELKIKNGIIEQLESELKDAYRGCASEEELAVAMDHYLEEADERERVRLREMEDELNKRLQELQEQNGDEERLSVNTFIDWAEQLPSTQNDRAKTIKEAILDSFDPKRISEENKARIKKLGMKETPTHFDRMFDIYGNKEVNIGNV